MAGARVLEPRGDRGARRRGRRRRDRLRAPRAPALCPAGLLFSYAAIAVAGLLAWSGRLRAGVLRSHWYAAAALFLFPWILSIAHVMLFSAPVRGVVQAIVAGWYAQCAWTLWLAPLALSVAYYVVPKVTGKILPSYEFASLGFWCLIFVGGLTGGRHLLGGPVPAWIPSVAVVSCAPPAFPHVRRDPEPAGGILGQRDRSQVHRLRPRSVLRWGRLSTP